MNSAFPASLQLTSTWVWLMGDERVRGKRGSWVLTPCFLPTLVSWAVTASLHNYNMTRRPLTPASCAHQAPVTPHRPLLFPPRGGDSCLLLLPEHLNIPYRSP